MMKTNRYFPSTRMLALVAASLFGLLAAGCGTLVGPAWTTFDDRAPASRWGFVAGAGTPGSWVMQGSWTATQGTLVASVAEGQAMATFSDLLPRDLQVGFSLFFRSRAAGSAAGVALANSTYPLKRWYALEIASDFSRISLLRSGKITASVELTPSGVVRRVVLRKAGDILSVHVDGLEVLRARDLFPIPSPLRLDLFCRGTTAEFALLRMMRREAPRVSDPLGPAAEKIDFGEYGAARELIVNVLKNRHPVPSKSTELRAGLLSAFLFRGSARPQEARKMLERVARRDLSGPAGQRARLELARLLADRKRPSDALDVLYSLVYQAGVTTEVLPLLIEGVRTNVKELVKQARHRMAAFHLSRLVNHIEWMGVWDWEIPARLRLERAEVLFSAGMRDDARSELRTIVRRFRRARGARQHAMQTLAKLEQVEAPVQPAEPTPPAAKPAAEVPPPETPPAPLPEEVPETDKK